VRCTPMFTAVAAALVTSMLIMKRGRAGGARKRS
jgi:hypothetical protein